MVSYIRVGNGMIKEWWWDRDGRLTWELCSNILKSGFMLDEEQGMEDELWHKMNVAQCISVVVQRKD